MQAIKFNRFSCYYKIKKEYMAALEDINLDIPNGELFVVVGESGSGKTTMLKCIMGQCRYVKGELEVNGQAIDNLDVRESSFSYVSQEYSLYPHMTVFENIAFPLRTMHTPQNEVAERVKDIAEKLDISWLLTRKPKQLSGGQQQRAAIARALVKNPGIMLFDEPFSNVGPELRVELRELVRRIHREYKPAIVFVTHDLSEAFSLADRILVLENGRAVELGTPQQLMDNPRSELIKGFLKK